MAHDAFISYSTKDKRIADQVCTFLEGQGIRCWIAPRDILAGTEWNASIVTAINQSRIFILIYSAHSNASPQVQREVGWAANQGLTILPLRIEDVPMSEGLAYFISTRQWLDAFTPPLHKHLASLGKAVESLLQKQAPPPPVPAPEKRTPSQPTAPRPEAPPRTVQVSKQGWSAANWVLLGCGVLILLTVTALFASGWFAKKQLEKRAALAKAELVVQANPDFEVVSTDEEAGTMTLKNSKTGETVTANVKDIEQGRIELKTDKGTATYDASAKDGTIKVTDEQGEISNLQFGKAPPNLPPWLPVYPNGTLQGSFDLSTAEGRSATFTLETHDSGDKVLSFYQSELKKAGFKVDATPVDTSEEKGGLLTAIGQNPHREVSLLVGTYRGQMTATISFQEKR